MKVGRRGTFRRSLAFAAARGELTLANKQVALGTRWSCLVYANLPKALRQRM